MKQISLRQPYIALHLIIVAVLIVGSVVIVGYSQKSLHNALDIHIKERLNIIADLAEKTDRNAADAVTESIIQDCERRAEYESLLNNLSTLNKRDMITMQNLHEVCGDYYAERKALMVSKMRSELEVVEDLVELKDILHQKNNYKTLLLEWNTLITHEEARSTLLKEQNDLQGKIIARLISGATPNSGEVQSLVTEARETSELLNVNNQEIDTIRARLNNE